MKPVRLLIDKLYKLPFANKIKPLLDAVDAGMFGTDEVTTGGPHILDCVDIKRYMILVIVAMVPSVLAAICFFGFNVIKIIAVSYIVGGAVEVISATIRKKDIHEGFLITGLIYPLVLPPTTPLWIVAVGVVFGVLFGKEVFGGTGRNIFNPALVGRLFITLAFPAIMTTSWQQPLTHAMTTATPLSIYKSERIVTPYLDLLFGGAAGSMGETCRIVIILGGLFLILSKVSNWRIPVFYIATVFAFALIGNHLLPEIIAPAPFQLLTGGLLFGAFFMATDPVTSPFTRAGKCIFGISCGVLTVVIRSFSGYVEGVMFGIVLMNALTPLIDHIVLAFKFRPVKT